MTSKSTLNICKRLKQAENNLSIPLAVALICNLLIAYKSLAVHIMTPRHTKHLKRSVLRRVALLLLIVAAWAALTLTDFDALGH